MSAVLNIIIVFFDTKLAAEGGVAWRESSTT
jgi:hypothetical protein